VKIGWPDVGAVPDAVTEVGDRVMALCPSPLGDTLALECRGELLLMDAETLRVLRRWRADERKIRRMVFSPNGRYLASAGYDKLVKLWDTATGSPLRTLVGHRGRVSSVEFSGDGAMLVSGSSDRSVRIWSVDGEEIDTFHGHRAPIRCVAFSPDGTRVAAGDEAREIRVWNTSDGQVERCLLGHTGKVRCLGFRPDGHLVSGSSDGSVRLWDVETGRELRRLQAHGTRRTGKIRAIAFSPDYQIMVTGSQDRTARVWVGDEWSLLATLRGHLGIVTATGVSACAIFTSAEDHTVRRWALVAR
jgi:WD40 repeat protein